MFFHCSICHSLPSPLYSNSGIIASQWNEDRVRWMIFHVMSGFNVAVAQLNAQFVIHSFDRTGLEEHRSTVDACLAVLPERRFEGIFCLSSSWGDAYVIFLEGWWLNNPKVKNTVDGSEIRRSPRGIYICIYICIYIYVFYVYITLYIMG